MTQIQVRKIEIVAKRSIAQVQAKNEKIENFYKKIDAEKAAIAAKITKLKKQVIEQERKLYQTEKAGLEKNLFPIKLQATENLPEEIAFFENIQAVATAVNNENYSADTVYAINGKWYSARIGYPCDASGGPDEEKKFFEAKQVIEDDS